MSKAGRELAQLATNNNKLVDILTKDLEELRDKTEKELRRVQYDVYEEKFRVLRNECDDALNKIKTTARALADVKVEQVKDLLVPVKKVERILEFFRMDTRPEITTTDQIIGYSDRHKGYYRENLGVIFSDPYLEVRLFILQNDKPVNKFYMALAGKCLFDNGMADRPLLKLPHDYGIDNAQWGACPQQILKEAANVEDLHKWWKATGLSKMIWLSIYLGVRAEYEFNMKCYKLEDFQEFITFFCPRCGYFHTIFEHWTQRPGELMMCPRDKTVMVPREEHWPTQPTPKK
jgi:hypothetical protein